MNIKSVFGTIAKGLSLLPYLVQGAEAIHGAKTGPEKKGAVLDLAENAIGISEMISGKEIVDEKLFREGLDQVIEGQVKIMKACKKSV